MRTWLRKLFSELFVRDSAVSSGEVAEFSCQAAERGPWRRISTITRPAKAAHSAPSSAAPGCTGCAAADPPSRKRS